MAPYLKLYNKSNILISLMLQHSFLSNWHFLPCSNEQNRNNSSVYHKSKAILIEIVFHKICGNEHHLLNDCKALTNWTTSVQLKEMLSKLLSVFSKIKYYPKRIINELAD